MNPATRTRRTTLSHWLILLCATLMIGALVTGCDKLGGSSESEESEEEGSDDSAKEGEKTEDKEGDDEKAEDEEGDDERAEDEESDDEKAEDEEGDDEKAEDEESDEPTGPKIVKIDAGGEANCVLLEDGVVRCWGTNDEGDLGANIEDPERRYPVSVVAPTASDMWFTKSSGSLNLDYGSGQDNVGCVKFENGRVSCWGSNDGLFGDGEYRGSAAPVDIADLAVVQSIGYGDDTACGVTEEGKVHCWGSGAFDTLGRDVSDDEKYHAKPGEVEGLPGKATKADCGSSQCCALLEDGSAHCWGFQWGKKPKKVDGVVKAVDMEAGYGVTCFVLEGGLVHCAPPGGRPSAIPNTSKVTQLSMTGNNACGLTEEGKVLCFGRNRWGEAGDGTVDEPKKGAVEVQGLPAKATQVSVGGTHACALLEDNRVMCWGSNRRGQLGNGTFEDSPTPVEVQHLFEDAPAELVKDKPAMLPESYPDFPSDAPEECQKIPEPANATFKIHTSGVERDTTRQGFDTYDIVLANYPFEWEERPIPPRGEQEMYVASVWHEEVKRDESGYQDTDKLVEAGDYKIGWKEQMRLRARVRTRQGNVSVREGGLKLAYVGRNWICGTFDTATREGDKYVMRFAGKITNPRPEGQEIGGEPEALAGKAVKVAETDGGGDAKKPGEKKAATPEDVQALCAEWDDSVKNFGDNCKALGKRLQRKFRGSPVNFSSLPDGPEFASAAALCDKAEQAMSKCMDEAEVKAALKRVGK